MTDVYNKRALDYLDVYDFIHDHWLAIIAVTLLVYFVTPPLFIFTVPPDSYAYYETEIYPPGSYFMPPWVKSPVIISNAYKSIVIEIPSYTADGQKFIVVFNYLWVRWDPNVFQRNWHHNEASFRQYMAKELKPTVDEFMSTIDSHNIPINGNSMMEEMNTRLENAAHPHGFLTHQANLPAEHMTYLRYTN